MKLLLDAHALIWAVDDPPRLGPQALAAISDSRNDLFIGAGSVWELSIKVGLGKLTLSFPFQHWFERAMAELGVSLLPISAEHCAAQMTLPYHHRDPFDRLLIAQTQIESASVASCDPVFDLYDVKRVW